MTRLAAVGVGLTLALASAQGAGLAFAAPPGIGPAASLPSPPLGALPSIARVKVEVASDHVIVTEEVDLPSGAWHPGELLFYVAFGAPGAPEAIDAHLVAVPDGTLEPAPNDAGEKLVVDRAPHRPAKAFELIGADEMAGVVVHVPEASFKHAAAPGGMAALRLRTLLHLPPGDARSGHEVLVRLGQARTTPLTLAHVEVGAVEDGKPIARAEAHLCGQDADTWPLAVAIRGRAAPLPPLTGSDGPTAPVLAVRHPKDDLCVRFWPAE